MSFRTKHYFGVSHFSSLV